MSAANVQTTFTGCLGYVVPEWIDVHVDLGLPGFAIVGRGDARETRDRIRAALVNSGFEWPQQRITVTCEREGSDYDLPIALGILKASGQIDRLPDGPVFGTLGLDGSICGAAATLPDGRHAQLRDLTARLHAVDA